MEKILKNIEKKGERPSLLMHTCCAPCSSYPLDYLGKIFKITVFYYNPNITDEEEYIKRVAEQKRLIDSYNAEKNLDISFIEGAYNRELFFNAVRGYENCPEGGERCKICFELRLGATKDLAEEKGFDYYTTSLTISPLKNAELINQIGIAKSDGGSSNYLLSDFKKKNGYKKSIEFSKQYDLYRQNYCGCIYSKNEMEKRQNEKTD